jgi:drug/metabolite transporter (DMT)-like permease
MLAWGIAPVATRYVVLRIPPLSLLVVRFLIAALLFLPAAITALRKWNRRQIWTWIVASLLGIIGYYVPVTYGLQDVPASMGGLILASEPAWVLLFARVLRAEDFPRIAWIGALLSFAGAALLFIGSSLVGMSAKALLGALLVLLGGICFAAYSVALPPLTRTYGSLNTTALSTVIGTIPMLPFAVTVRASDFSGLGTIGWLSFAFLALGSTVIATVLWNFGVAAIGRARSGPYLNLVPFISVLGGYLLLSERLPALILISGALIIAGVLLAQRKSGSSYHPEGRP